MKNRLPSLSSTYAVIISVLCCAQSYVLFQNKQRLESDTSCPASSVVSSSVTALPRLPDSSSVPSDRPQSRRARLEAPPEPASPSQAPSTLDPDPDQIEPTQEETMGKSAYEEFQKKQIGKYRALQKIEAERTLSYLTDALGLHLSKQQKEMGLELLANAEDSEDLVSDKEVSFLSNRLELSAEQKNILRDSISSILTASVL